MAETALVKMSPKGQLVVPTNIRQKENFKSGDRFISFEIKGGVLFKKVRLPDVKAEFQSLSKEIEKQFTKNKIKEKDIEEAVRWARKG